MFLSKKGTASVTI